MGSGAIGQVMMYGLAGIGAKKLILDPIQQAKKDAEKQMKETEARQNKLLADERIREGQAESTEKALLAKARQKNSGTAGGRADTILTSPLGLVGTPAPAGPVGKTLLGA